jgi:clan AA aspartic protease
MGYVYAQVKFTGPKGKSLERRVLVDTGATYTCIPYKMAQELELLLQFETKVTLADGGEVKAWHSAAYIEINGRGDAMQVRVFDIMEPVIGAFTLEGLGLAVDPASGELRPTRSYISRA